MSEEIGTHLMIALRDRRVLTSSRDMRLGLARSVLERGEQFDLLAFRAADTHLHALVARPRREALEFARRVEISLQLRFKYGVTFSAPHLVAVRTQSHLANTFWYCLRQEQRHRTSFDPAFEASNLPDLLGWRVIAPWAGRVAIAHLPRIRRSELLAQLPVEVDPATPPANHVLRRAAAAAVARTHLPTRGPLFRRMLAAAVVAAGRDRSLAAVAHSLRISPRSVVTFRQLEVSPSDVAAVAAQARLIEAVAPLRGPLAG